MREERVEERRESGERVVQNKKENKKWGDGEEGM